MIPLRDQEYLRARFARDMVGAVRIDYFTQRKLPIFIPGREELRQDIERAIAAKRLAWLRRALTSYIVRNCRETAAGKS